MSKIQYETDGDVAVIIFNDPPLNVFSEQHWDEMIAAVGKAAAAGHRALLIRAEGPNFSGGADVEIFHKRGAEEARSILARYLTISHTLENLPFPVIAAVRGVSRFQCSAVSATKPPIDKSQARVGSPSDRLCRST